VGAQGAAECAADTGREALVSESGASGPGDQAEVRLFAFHHAGGSHTLFQGWRSRLPPNWDVRLLNAPGHGNLFGQPLIDDLGRLADHFLQHIGPELNGPYAFFGHSMGGLIACELAQRLVAEGHSRPVWLGVSASRPPGYVPTVLRHKLSDSELRRHVGGMGGTPAPVLEDPQLWEVFEPLFRADFRLVETGLPDYERPLPVPLTVFGGRDDASVPAEMLSAWARQSTAFQGTRLLDGGHFYFSADPGPLLEHVIHDIRTALGALTEPSG
jgi:surfactin synthase thioesterase subunit